MNPDPTPRKPSRSWRITPALGAVALVAALAGGAVAAIVTVSLDKTSRRATTVTVHDVTTAPRTLSSTAPTPDVETNATSSNAKTTTSTGAGLSLEAIYKADARGVVSVITTTADGVAQGSGIVLDTSGYILTNQHVVDGWKSVRVSFSNSDNVKAKVIGTDASTDLAVLKVGLPASALHPLPLGDSASVQVGDSVVAIGNPFGLDRTLTAGIISAVHREISAPNRFAIRNALQTDAAINHGNSGGPLIDRNGAVIGINAQLPSNSQVNGNVGVGFAIPVNIAKTVIPQLEQHGHVAHPWLGLEGDTIDSSLASAAHVPVAHGVLIEGIVPGSPIAKAGLKGGTSSVIVNGMGYCLGGDVITKIDGTAVSSVDALQTLLSSHDPGETLTVHVVHRGGTSKDYAVKLGAQPQQGTAAVSGCPGSAPELRPSGGGERRATSAGAYRADELGGRRIGIRDGTARHTGEPGSRLRRRVRDAHPGLHEPIAARVRDDVEDISALERQDRPEHELGAVHVRAGDRHAGAARQTRRLDDATREADRAVAAGGRRDALGGTRRAQRGRREGVEAGLDDLGGHDPDPAGVAPLEHDRTLGSELDVRGGDHERATFDVIDTSAVANALDHDRDAGVDARGDDRGRRGEAAAKLQHHAVSIGG